MPLSTKEAGSPRGRSDNLVTIPAGSSQAARRGGRMLIPPVVTLAAWRVRQTWRLLLVTGAGIIAAVMLVCAVPLYSEVSMSAGLRSALSTSFQTSDIIVQGSSAQISAQFISQATHSINSESQQKLGPYLSSPEFSIETPVEPLVVGQPGPGNSLQKTNDQIRFITASMGQAAAHVRLVAGRLPLTDSDAIEIALTPESANRLHVTVGSLLTTGVAFSEIPVKHVVPTYTLHVVGIFELAPAGDSYWHGNDYISISRGRVPGYIYTALASNENLIAVFNRTANDPTISGTTLDGPFTLFWYYPLNPARIGINNLDTILAGVNSVQVDIANNPNLNRAPYLTQTTALLPSNILQLFHDRAAVARIPVTSLLVFVLGLVLFFVSMMADFLVDRQSEAISILRSRGASRSQIFGSFTIQSLALGLFALVIGPLLAAAAVFFIVPAADRGSLSLIAGDPWGTALSLAGYALVAAVACITAMVIAIYRAMQLDVLAMRREAARSTHRPLWQRINLDIVAVIITLTGFAITLYLTNSGVLDAQLRLLLLSPLTLLGIVF
ncbi:MAG TPA: FtsX-like permease family protein, partial [Ktedonobacteraceae bacterium]|nr:FtsX-like permease family protein [Ktedonobacteraceae bacterium]